jgi:acyl-coenzyme A synthetase/AMP-(fatty) acid ligase
MYVDFLLDRFEANPSNEAMVWKGKSATYAELLEKYQEAVTRIDDAGIQPSSVVSIEADFSANSVAYLLALAEKGCTLVPLTSSVEASKPEFREIAEVEWQVMISDADQVEFVSLGRTPTHPILTGLKQTGHPGLILFSSGSTGKPKAAVHDLSLLLEKFHVPRYSRRTIAFLLFDHIGGINTLLYTLSNAGCVITVQDRSPDAVCEVIEKHQAEVLPTSPTFLNLLLISGAVQRHDLSSLKLITYGTEPMPEATLKRLHQTLPNVELLQTYGLSEVGILRSKSESSDSLWVKIGGEGYETRVVDGLLEIKAKSAMLGYLNAESPFTEDGWFKTGDAVEVKGEYFKILGRKSEMINVGGEKVYPAEVEGILTSMEGVEDAVVTGERNAITGMMVKATVRLSTGESPAEFRKRMREFCADKLASFKVPQKVEIVSESLHGERFKKLRSKLQ